MNNSSVDLRYFPRTVVVWRTLSGCEPCSLQQRRVSICSHVLRRLEKGRPITPKSRPSLGRICQRIIIPTRPPIFYQCEVPQDQGPRSRTEIVSVSSKTSGVLRLHESHQRANATCRNCEKGEESAQQRFLILDTARMRGGEGCIPQISCATARHNYRDAHIVDCSWFRSAAHSVQLRHPLITVIWHAIFFLSKVVGILLHCGASGHRAIQSSPHLVTNYGLLSVFEAGTCKVSGGCTCANTTLESKWALSQPN